jgi:hypothetical protein
MAGPVLPDLSRRRRRLAPLNGSKALPDTFGSSAFEVGSGMAFGASSGRAM